MCFHSNCIGTIFVRDCVFKHFVSSRTRALQTPAGFTLILRSSGKAFIIYYTTLEMRKPRLREEEQLAEVIQLCGPPGIRGPSLRRQGICI